MIIWRSDLLGPAGLVQWIILANANLGLRSSRPVSRCLHFSWTRNSTILPKICEIYTWAHATASCNYNTLATIYLQCVTCTRLFYTFHLDWTYPFVYKKTTLFCLHFRRVQIGSRLDPCLHNQRKGYNLFPSTVRLHRNSPSWIVY